MDIFRTLDANGSEVITLTDVLQGPDEIKEELMSLCSLDEPQAVFELLDTDGSGAVDIQEFCDGIMRVHVDKPTELLRLMRQCSHILIYSKKIHAAIESRYSML